MTLPYGTEQLYADAWVDEDGRVHKPALAAVEDHNAYMASVLGEATHDGPSSWVPVDLGPYLRGEITRPEPSVGLARTDGVHLLYPRLEHTVIGEMESGKSWFSLACTATELLAGHHVVYIHFEENDPSDTLDRLRALGVPTSDIFTRFRFVGPEQPVTATELAALLDPAPSLVVLDGVNEAMALHTQSVNDTDGPANYRRRLVKPCTRAGAAVLSCDHVVKDPEKRGRGPLGSVHKGNGLNGSLILLENAEPFGRGARGASHVFVTKDRPGFLRRNGNATKIPGRTYLGTLTVDDTQEYSPNLELRFHAPRDDEAGTADAPTTATTAELDEHILETVQEIITGGFDASLRRVRAQAKFRAGAVDMALERLVLARRLTENVGTRKARIFSVTVSQDQKE